MRASDGSPRRRSRGAARLLALSAAVVAAIAALEAGLALARPEAGLWALLQILSMLPALAGIAFAPLSLSRDAGPLRLTVAALAVIVVGRFGPEWLSMPPSDGPGTQVDVVTWNVEAGSRAAVTTTEALRAIEADVIALQELQPPTSDAIEADPLIRERFPYQALEPRDDLAGMGLLSGHPLEAPTYSTGPPLQAAWVVIDGRSVRILNGHPFPAPFGQRILGIPVGFDPTIRNQQLKFIRDQVDADVAVGEPVILLGDFNTAPTEPAFERLVAGLRDAHAEVGLGPGWTWRPSSLELVPFGLLRLDLVVGGPGVVPLATDIRCPPAGDHCQLSARLRIEFYP